MEMNFYMEREKYFWASLLADLLAEFAAVIVTVVGSLALGGFSFRLPWLIVSPVVLFLTGFVRGPSFGNSWGQSSGDRYSCLDANGCLPQGHNRSGQRGNNTGRHLNSCAFDRRRGRIPEAQLLIRRITRTLDKSGLELRPSKQIPPVAPSF
jgi:hypothetical protein